jgi:hypothetical protein
MRVFTTCLFLITAACAGPGQQKLSETPTAHTKANTGEAPPASGADEDRTHEVDAMSDMKAAEDAHAEAADAPGVPAPTKKPAGSPGKAKPAATPASPDKAP